MKNALFRSVIVPWLVVAAWLGIFAVSSGCGPCSWSKDPITCECWRVWPIKTNSGAQVTADRVVAAVVVRNAAASFDAADLTVNGGKIPTDTSVSASHQILLANEMSARGLYTAGTDAIMYFRTTSPMTLRNTDAGLVRLRLPGNWSQPASFPGPLVIPCGAAAEMDLNNGAPLTTFQSLVDNTAAGGGGVPLLDDVALVVFALILLGAGGFLIHRFRTTTTLARAAA